MSLRDETKKIQKAVGVASDGSYNKDTILKIIGKLDFSKQDLTKIIQKKANSLPDGIYGKNTAKNILRVLGVETEEEKKELIDWTILTKVQLVGFVRLNPKYHIIVL